MLNWRISSIVILDTTIHSPKYYQNPEREIIKFRQTINFYYKILFILWKYWLLNSHNSKLVAGGYLFWEWKLQLLISQCANWFDIWWSKKLNREPVCSFFKDFCNLLEGVMTSKHIHRSEKNWKVARFLIKDCKMQISNIYIGGGKLEKLMTFFGSTTLFWHYADMC